MACHGSCGESAPITAISDGAAAPSTLLCEPRAAPAARRSRLVPETREKIRNFGEQSCEINLLWLGKDAPMTPWQGIFDRRLTPAGREPAALWPPFSDARYTAILAPRRQGSQPARSYCVSAASPALATCSSSSGVAKLAPMPPITSPSTTTGSPPRASAAAPDPGFPLSRE